MATPGIESTTGDPPPPHEGSITAMFPGLGQGENRALAEIWRRFFPRLSGLARRTLASFPSHNVEAEDVVQSAFISFWLAVDERRGYHWSGRDDLWRLLATITARKARKKVRRETAQKRGGAQNREELSDDALAVRQLGKLSPVEFDAIGEEMLLGLNERRRTTALLRLQGCTDDEIAGRLGCSRRSVERELAAIRQQWSEPLI
jgi:RNA polymerase sigma factor (sigma-70 family)